MPARFAVLASGSQGNSCLVQTGRVGLLIDAGLGPRILEQRLEHLGVPPERIAAVVLTHLHADHFHPQTLAWMNRRNVTLHLHESQVDRLVGHPDFESLARAGRVLSFDSRPWPTPLGLTIEAIDLTHDAETTHGFRLEGRPTRREAPVALGLATDTGAWTPALAEALAQVDLLAIEFNHDSQMQRESGRPAFLIRRVMSDAGHLSNEQAGLLLADITRRSGAHPPRDVVLMHLSRQCNRPDLALQAARAALASVGRRARLHVGLQHQAGPDLTLYGRGRRGPAIPSTLAHSSTRTRRPVMVQDPPDVPF